jgi:hypothetical protein
MNNIQQIIKRGEDQDYDKELLAELLAHRTFSSCEISDDELWYEINGDGWGIRMKTYFHNDILFDNMSDADKIRHMRAYRD